MFALIIEQSFFRNMTVVIHSFDVFERLILSFDYGLAVLYFTRCLVILVFSML